jgi:hypothetical protein
MAANRLGRTAPFNFELKSLVRKYTFPEAIFVIQIPSGPLVHAGSISQPRLAPSFLNKGVEFDPFEPMIM